MNDHVTLGQVVAAFAFALVRGWISTTLQLAHKQPCALISFAAGTLLGVIISDFAGKFARVSLLACSCDRSFNDVFIAPSE